MLKEGVCVALSDILSQGIDVHRCAAARALGAIGAPTSFETLIKALLDEDPDVRADAAEALSKLCDPRSADPLMQSLIGDPCCEVKLSAITTLVHLRHQDVVPWLRRIAVSRDEEIAWDDGEFYGGGWDDWLDVQIAAIRGLADLGAEDGVPEIVAALEDENSQEITSHVVSALLRLGKPGLTALEGLFSKGNTKLRRTIAAEIGGDTADAEIEKLRSRCLGDKSAEVRIAALIGLNQSDANDDRLEAFFDDKDADIRKKVLELAGTRHPEATRLCLDDPSPSVRTAAFTVIADSPQLFEREGFGQVLRAGIWDKATAAAKAVVAWARVAGEQALPDLEKFLNNASYPVVFRRGVIRALTCLDASATGPLAAAAADDDRQIRLDALTALAGKATATGTWPSAAGDVLLAALAGELVAAPVEEKSGESSPIDDEAEKASASRQALPDDAISKASEPDGVEAGRADGDEAGLRGNAGGSVSTLQTILSPQEDKGATNDNSPEVELTEQDRKFLEISKQRAIRKKKVALDAPVAPHNDVRRFAARLLGDIHNDAVVVPLVEALKDSDRDLRHAALESLTQVGDGLGGLPHETFEALTPIVADADIELRMLAVRAIGLVACECSSAVLHELIEDENPHVRLEALRALDSRGEISAGVKACLKDENTGVRLAAAKALAKHYGRDAIDALVDFAFFADGTHRSQASRLLAGIAPEQAAGRFMSVLADESQKRMWLVAIEALGELAPHFDLEQEHAAA